MSSAALQWSLTSHCCRICLGRVLRCGNDYRCSSCGAAARDKPHGICGCGITVGGRRHHRCAPNPHRSATSPAEVVIVLDGSEQEGVAT